MFRRGKFSCPVALACAALLAISPATGQDAAGPMPQDEEGLWMLVEKQEQMLRTSNRNVADEELLAYLHDLTCRTLGGRCGELRLYVFRAPGFNAFMMPNGAMFIHTGLLLRVGDEAELSAVLGHEASHFFRKHTVEQMRRWSKTASRLAVLNSIVAAAGAMDAESAGTASSALQVAGVVAGFQMLAYNRDQERQADEDGIHWMTEQGMDPGGAPRIWRKLIAEQEAGGKEAGFSLLATHPAPEERLNYLSTIAGSSVRSAGDSGQDAVPEVAPPASKRLLELVGPRRMEWIGDELEVQDPKQFAAILAAQSGFGIDGGMRYYLEAKSWIKRADKQRRGATEALEAADTALQAGADAADSMPAEAWREWAKVSLRLGKPAAARSRFEKYLELAPDAWDARFVRRELERL